MPIGWHDVMKNKRHNIRPKWSRRIFVWKAIMHFGSNLVATFFSTHLISHITCLILFKTLTNTRTIWNDKEKWTECKMCYGIFVVNKKKTQKYITHMALKCKQILCECIAPHKRGETWIPRTDSIPFIWFIFSTSSSSSTLSIFWLTVFTAFWKFPQRKERTFFIFSIISYLSLCVVPCLVKNFQHNLCCIVRSLCKHMHIQVKKKTQIKKTWNINLQNKFFSLEIVLFSQFAMQSLHRLPIYCCYSDDLHVYLYAKWWTTI